LDAPLDVAPALYALTGPPLAFTPPPPPPPPPDDEEEEEEEDAEDVTFGLLLAGEE